MELSQRLDLGEAVEVEQPQDAFARLSSLLDDHFDLTVSPTTPLTDSGLSSLDMIELAIRIEEQFGVRVTEQVYEAHITVGDLADYLAEEEDA